MALAEHVLALCRRTDTKVAAQGSGLADHHQQTRLRSAAGRHSDVAKSSESCSCRTKISRPTDAANEPMQLAGCCGKRSCGGQFTREPLAPYFVAGHSHEREGVEPLGFRWAVPTPPRKTCLLPRSRNCSPELD